MSRYEFIAPCHFGTEMVLKKEILDLGNKTVTTNLDKSV